MAKSLRSKRRRKVRAEKRIVNAKKELVKLREVAARLHGTDLVGGEEALESAIPDVKLAEQPMQIDGESIIGDTNKAKGIRINNQWMNQRKIKAIKNKIKHHDRKKARRAGPAAISSRKSNKRRK